MKAEREAVVGKASALLYNKRRECVVELQEHVDHLGNNLVLMGVVLSVTRGRTA